MNENKTSKTTTSLLIAVIVLFVIIIAGGVFLFVKMNEKKEEPAPSAAGLKIGMESDVITNEGDAASVGLGKPSSLTTWYERNIYITNGNMATCMIGNDASNYYEMYIQIYLNDKDGIMDEEQKLYVSKLIPRGSHIESFTADMELEPGEYEGTLIYSSVDESGALISDTPFVVDIHVAQ